MAAAIPFLIKAAPLISAGVGAASIFSGGGGPKTPGAAPAPPGRSAAEVQAEESEERRRRSRARGRATTILTEGQTLGQVGGKTLLGQ